MGELATTPVLRDGMSAAEEAAIIGHLAIIPDILRLVCLSTGMGFAAVARVTPEQWIACQVLDEIKFGLKPGGELKVDTTICHEIRQSGVEVVIDHVERDQVYRSHHTPLMYGFQSYISVPIRHKDRFYGTLCAIDPRPALLNIPEIISLFKTCAMLISLHLGAMDRLKATEIAAFNEQSRDALMRQVHALTDFPAGSTTGVGAKNAAIDRSSNEFRAIVSHCTYNIAQLIYQLSGNLRTGV